MPGIRAPYIGLVIAVLLAAALRLPQMSDSLWLDELHTAWCASGSLADVAPRASIGNHAPLYFYLPYVTTSVFGLSEFNLRLPSLIAGLALVAVVGTLVWQWTG